MLVAHTEGQPVGYAWLSFRNGMEAAFGATWIIRPGEAMRYRNLVHPRFRGRGLHSFLNLTVNRYAADHGITRTLDSISLFNRQSLALAKHYRKAKTMMLILVRFRFLPQTFGWAFGAPLGSRIALSRNPSFGEFQSVLSLE